MAVLLGISDWMIPSIMIGIIIYGLLKNVNAYEAFIPSWATSFLSTEPNEVIQTGVEIMWDAAMLPNNPQTFGEDW